MASIFKRTRTYPIPEGAEIKTYRKRPHAVWTDGRGRQRREPLTDDGERIVVESPTWYITYTTANGERKTKAGARDKQATESIARKLESTEREYKHGSRDQRAEKLGEHERAPIEQHLRDFEAAMEGRGSSAKHVDNTMAYIRGVLQVCGFETAADLDPAAIQSHIGTLLRQGTSKSGANHKIGAAKQFSRWLHQSGRLRVDPLAGLAKLNDRDDRRRQRRALGDDEVGRLLHMTRQGEAWTWREGGEPRSIDGPTRALLYELALGSGLRASELATLSMGAFKLKDPSNAAVVVEAGYSKHRREDHQPIAEPLARKLAEHLKGRRKAERAFIMPPTTKTAAMLKADLEAARKAWLAEAGDDPTEQARRAERPFCAYCDDAGRYVDFHALRHTYISRLARSGVHPSVAKKLARHGSIQLTMDHSPIRW